MNAINKSKILIRSIFFCGILFLTFCRSDCATEKKCCDCSGANDNCDIKNFDFYLQVGNGTSEEVSIRLEVHHYIGQDCEEPSDSIISLFFKIPPHSSKTFSNLYTQNAVLDSSSRERVIIYFLHPDMITKTLYQWVSENGWIVFNVSYSDGVYYFWH